MRIEPMTYKEKVVLAPTETRPDFPLHTKSLVYYIKHASENSFTIKVLTINRPSFHLIQILVNNSNMTMTLLKLVQDII